MCHFKVGVLIVLLFEVAQIVMSVHTMPKTANFPTVSFDFCYTRAVGDDEDDKRAVSSLWMVMCDSTTGHVGCVPLRNKNQVKLAVCELMAFTQNIGHHAVTYLCDNEPSIRVILRALISARHSLGLPTRIQTSKVGDHSNALAENTVARVRQLAGSFMDQLHTKLNLKLGTKNGLWSWAARHAAWTLSRYKAVKGATPYELVYGRPYVGTLLQFAEPCFAYVATSAKGMKKWIKGIFLGKTEGQDAFIIYDGSKVLLTRSTRRISQSWGLSLAFYKDFSCPTYDFQTGFGARIVPTKRDALPASDAWIPLEAIAAKAKDPDAEAVIKKAIEESREEKELEMMGKFDKPDPVVLAEVEGDVFVEAPMEETPLAPTPGQATARPTGADGAKPDSLPQRSSQPQQQELSSLPLRSPQVPQQPAQAIPPAATFGAASSSSTADEPRSSPTRRGSTDESGMPKRAKMSPVKKPRIERISEEMEANIRTIKFGNEELYTMDEPEVEPSDFLEEEISFEDDEDAVDFIPEWLWYDGVPDEKPPEPSKEVDEGAAQVEMKRLMGLGVLREAQCSDDFIQRTLTTRFVYDWRWKPFGKVEDGEEPTFKWLRRARLVAREYAFAEGKRDDVFSPASSAHLLRLLPTLFRSKVAQDEFLSSDPYVLGSLDVKDAFLQVEQREPLRLKMSSGDYIVTFQDNELAQRIGLITLVVFSAPKQTSSSVL
eukprot:s280_g10.t1